MAKIKHSKYKNTGILFELLVHQITSDTLKGKESPAINILKKYFAKTQLGKEHKLYDSIIKSSNLTEGKANIVISSVLENSKQLKRNILKRQKYNLISEIKDNYNIEEFFSIPLNNYKEFAAVYTLIESVNSPDISNPDQLISNKITLLEHLCNEVVNEEDEFKSIEDKDLRILTYNILLEKFNSKYKDFNSYQKNVLKEYIISNDSVEGLRNFYNTNVNSLKLSLLNSSKNIDDKATKIKVIETTKLLTPIGKNTKICEDRILDLLQYSELLGEIEKI